MEICSKGNTLGRCKCFLSIETPNLLCSVKVWKCESVKVRKCKSESVKVWKWKCKSVKVCNTLDLCKCCLSIETANLLCTFQVNLWWQRLWNKLVEHSVSNASGIGCVKNISVSSILQLLSDRIWFWRHQRGSYSCKHKFTPSLAWPN